MPKEGCVQVGMEAEGRLLDKIALRNGLSVSFFDHSRPMAGDRCQVQLLVDIPVKVKREYLEESPDSSAAFQALVGALGNSISYQTVKVRNFIDVKDSEKVLELLKEEFLRANRAYFENPDFARRFVAKKYREWVREANCRRSHMEAVMRAERDAEG
jgi:hypothetical protein